MDMTIAMKKVLSPSSEIVISNKPAVKALSILSNFSGFVTISLSELDESAALHPAHNRGELGEGLAFKL